MNELRELYQEVILDHNRRPRNFAVPAESSRQADGHNPLCGDQLTVYLDIEGDTIREAHFMGTGCAISVASASMMTEAVKGMSVNEAEALFQTFHRAMTDDSKIDTILDEASELDSLSGVKEFPVRVKCATLAWHTLSAALHGEDRATTEVS